MPTSVYRQAEHPLTIEAGPAESVHIPEGGDAELELPENYDDDAYEGYEAMLQLQAEAAASESLALRLGSPRFARPSALSPFAEEAVDEASSSPELEAPPPAPPVVAEVDGLPLHLSDRGAVGPATKRQVQVPRKHMIIRAPPRG